MARPKRKVNPILPVAAPAEATKKLYQAGGYVRLSVEDSGKPGADTIETQRELIQSYISSQPDMRLYDLYCDNGRTGTNFDRPEFERMMETYPVSGATTGRLESTWKGCSPCWECGSSRSMTTLIR